MDARVEELTKTIIARQLGLRREQIKLTHRFRIDYGCDNLALIGMALDIEDLEHTEFPFPMLEQVETVSDLVEVVSELLQAREHVRSRAVESVAHKLTA
jgi:acyl carrier protein